MEEHSNRLIRTIILTTYTYLNNLLFADDIIFVSDNFVEMTKMTNDLKKAF